MSDLHFEHYSDYGKSFVAGLPNEKGRVLVLAGDIWSCAPHRQAQTEARVAELCEKYDDIVYVAGNHEYYGTSLEAELFLQDLAARYPAFHFLSRWSPTATIQGQRFIGDTMWFPETPATFPREKHFSDFHRIEALAKWCYDRNDAFRDFLQKNLTADDIVVTHHMCSPKSIAPQYIGDSYNCFFLSDMTDIIVTKSPKLWIHGHTHEQFDYMIDKTRVIVNPRGYPFEPTQKNFNPDLVIEI